MAKQRRFEIRKEGEIAICTLIDRKILDEQNIQAIGDDLWKLVDEEGCTQIVVDFQRVEYYSSATSGKFITLNKKVAAKNGKLVLCSVNEDIFEVFEIQRLDRLFTFCKDEADALKKFQE